MSELSTAIDELLAKMEQTDPYHSRRKSIISLIESVCLDVIGNNDIIEFGDPLLSPTHASSDARSRDKLRAELKVRLERKIKT